MMESFSCKRNFILEEPEGWLSDYKFLGRYATLLKTITTF